MPFLIFLFFLCLNLLAVVLIIFVIVLYDFFYLFKKLAKQENSYARYHDHNVVAQPPSQEAHNTAQHTLHAAFAPFFVALHAGLKALDKTLRQLEKQQADAAQAKGKRGSTERSTKALKTALEALHTEVKESESWFAHIAWLQQRFPQARYEDVTGLARDTSPARAGKIGRAHV